MSVLALADATTLLGQTVREELEPLAGAHEIRLLASGDDADGTLTQVGGTVALVYTLAEESLADVDLAILCGNADAQQRALELLPGGASAIVLQQEPGPPGSGHVAVAGINDLTSIDESILISPHPAVIAVSHLAAPLVPLGVVQVTATVLLPTSIHNEAGLDELFEQTRSILNFQGDLPTEVFPSQLAFNLHPGPAASVLGPQISAVLGVETTASVQLLQAAVFHSVAVSARVELAETVDADHLREALEGSAYIELSEAESTLGPIDAAGRRELLVGRIEPGAGEATAFWIWAVMDNLTRGGASNAVELAERILGER